ncbi:MAG: hypothetical protein ACM3PY_08165 [Omnitrophica WOR_2 bacterium]
MARDLRRYKSQTTVQLVAGFLLILFVVGDGLIYRFYGRSAALTGLICLLAGLTPLVLIALALLIMEWVVHHAREQ